MYGDIVFYTDGSTIECGSEIFEASELTADILNFAPEDYRPIQRLYHQEGKEPSEICALLGIPLRAVLRAISHPTHFLSVYDLQDPDDDGDVYEWFTTNCLSDSAEDAVIRALTMKCLREEFMQLSKRDQEILERCFSVYGFPKSDLREIAMRNRIKESSVEKAKNQAMQRLRDRYLDGFSWKLRRARQMVDRLIPTETKSFLDPVQ